MRELLVISEEFVATLPDDLIRQAIKDRDFPPALFDQIAYNEGRPAAIAALLVGKRRYHDHVPGEECHCS